MKLQEIHISFHSGNYKRMEYANTELGKNKLGSLYINIYLKNGLTLCQRINPLFKFEFKNILVYNKILLS